MAPTFPSFQPPPSVAHRGRSHVPRFVHTSDWHLGATLGGHARDEDHARFLAWLVELLRDRNADALIVAGDVFDQSQPSAEAQQLYFRFLRDVRTAGVRNVVIVGGNHDSASRLDAPRDVLAHLDVSVVGGFTADDANGTRCLVPVRDPRGDVVAVVLAVPFLHEFRLGVRTSTGSVDEIRENFRERFTALYTTLTDRAIAMHPGVPIVATGHLACVGADRGDAPADVHMIGTLGGLPWSIFDPRIDYVALGHIHRGYQVSTSRAWYCGTPVALTMREALAPRHVLLVEVDGTGKPPRVEHVPVPRTRDLIELRGDIEQIEIRLGTLRTDAPLVPMVNVLVEVSHTQASVGDRVRRAVERNTVANIRLVGLQQLLATSETANASTIAVAPRLADLTPTQVFERLCASRNIVPDDSLRRTFDEILSARDEVEPGTR